MTEKEKLTRLIKRECTRLALRQAKLMANDISLTSLEPERHYLLGILKGYEIVFGTKDTRQLDMYLWKRRYRALRLYLYWMGCDRYER